VSITELLDLVEESTSLEYEQDMGFGADKYYDFDNGKVGITIIHNTVRNIITMTCKHGQELLKTRLDELDSQSGHRTIKAAIMTAMLGR
jgi:hypothetical protein